MRMFTFLSKNFIASIFLFAVYGSAVAETMDGCYAESPGKPVQIRFEKYKTGLIPVFVGEEKTNAAIKQKIDQFVMMPQKDGNANATKMLREARKDFPQVVDHMLSEKIGLLRLEKPFKWDVASKPKVTSDYVIIMGLDLDPIMRIACK